MALLPPDVQAAVIDCCLDHPEWGSPGGAWLHGLLLQCYARYGEGPTHPIFRSAWASAGFPEAFRGDVELAEVTLGERGLGRYLVPAESYGEAAVLSGVVTDNDLVIDVLARRFDPELPFPLVLPYDEWQRLMLPYAFADDEGAAG